MKCRKCGTDMMFKVKGKILLFVCPKCLCKEERDFVFPWDDEADSEIDLAHTIKEIKGE